MLWKRGLILFKSRTFSLKKQITLKNLKDFNFSENHLKSMKDKYIQCILEFYPSYNYHNLCKATTYSLLLSLTHIIIRPQWLSGRSLISAGWGHLFDSCSCSCHALWTNTVYLGSLGVLPFPNTFFIPLTHPSAFIRPEPKSLEYMFYFHCDSIVILLSYSFLFYFDINIFRVIFHPLHFLNL